MSPTNGGTECLVRVRAISIKSACQADHFEITYTWLVIKALRAATSLTVIG